MIDWEIEKKGENGDILVYQLTGQLAEVECDYLLSVIENQIGEGHDKAVLDCQQLEFLSSLGMAMLIRVHAKMKKAGGNVKLARVHGPIATAISVVHLDRIFHLYPSVEEAVESFDT